MMRSTHCHESLNSNSNYEEDTTAKCDPGQNIRTYMKGKKWTYCNFLKGFLLGIV